MNIPELVERQNLIIKEQAKVIDSLFLLLLEHVNAAELDELDEISKINQIAQLRGDIEQIDYGE